MPLNDGKVFPITEDQRKKWEALYPSVDVGSELNKMVGWLDANPRKRKTKGGILKFCNSWLSNEQDRGGQTRPRTAPLTAGSQNPFLALLEKERREGGSP
jgi:hypothetical protein